MGIVMLVFFSLFLLCWSLLHCYDSARGSIEHFKNQVAWNGPDKDGPLFMGIFGAVACGLLGIMVNSSLALEWGQDMSALIGATIGAWVGSSGLVRITRAIVRFHHPGTTFRRDREALVIERLGAKRAFRFGWVANLL